MNSKETHNILINQGDQSQAAELVSLLRRAGLNIRVQEFDGLQLPDEVPGEHIHDMVLLLADAIGQECETLIRQLQASHRDIPCLLICRTPARWLPMLNLGVAGLVTESQLSAASGQLQFVYQVRRELDQLSQRRKARRVAGTVRELQQRMQLFMDNSQDAVACLQDGFHEYANLAWLRFFGFQDLAEIRGISFLDLIAGEDVERVRGFLRGPFPAGSQRCEFTAVCRDGREVLAAMDSATVTINGEQGLQLAIRPAQGNVAHANAAREAGSRDLQSGVLNEEHLMLAINQAISSAVHQGSHSSLIMVSLPKLAELAVILGKADMHLLLRDLASALHAQCPPHAVLGRLDAGDFVVLTADADAENCQALIRKLDGLHSSVVPLLPNGMSLQLHIGAALITDEAPDIDTLLIRSRQHQSTRRHHQRNTTSDGSRSTHHDAVLQHVRQALQDSTVLLVYQPTICLRADMREYYEVRVRVPHPDKLIYPEEFLEAANLHGIGERLDRYVISQALNAIRHHNKPQLRLTINLTANSLLSQTLAMWITQELQRQQQTPRQLILQISEVDFMSAPEPAREFCRRLRELGFELSLTHFGCSLDPLRMIGQLQVDYVKLDRSLLQNITVDPRQRERLNEVVSALHAQGIRVIAPMVEDVELLPLLWQATVNFVQGNCLQQPSDTLEFGLFAEEEINQLPAG